MCSMHVSLHFAAPQTTAKKEQVKNVVKLFDSCLDQELQGI